MTKIEIAKAFVDSHKDADIDNWQPMNLNDDAKLESIYNNMVGGVYGECRDNAEYGEDGEIVTEADEFEIEIASHESASGNPVLFDFEPAE